MESVNRQKKASAPRILSQFSDHVEVTTVAEAHLYPVRGTLCNPGRRPPWTPQAIHRLIEDRYDVTYHPAHLSRKLRAAGMNYAKPRPMDPRSPDDADEILAERLPEALGEADHDTEEDDPVVLGFFRGSVATTVREFTADVVVGSDGLDSKAVSNVSVAVDWVLRVD